MSIMQILNDREKIKHFVVYGFFGVLSTIVSFGSFYILRKYYSEVDENILNVFSIIIAIIFAYIVNRKYVFKSNDKKILKEFIKFCGSRAFSFLFEVVAFFELNTLLKIDGMISKISVTFVVIILNYITSSIFVFKNKEVKEENSK